MCTVLFSHKCFKEDDENCTIYLLPWLEMDYDKEFRVFVYNNEITALSAQHLYSVNEWLTKMTKKEQEQLVNKIIKYHREHIKDNMIYMKDYVMDLAYFIEANSFGSNYASGSALFHWLDDHDMLHSTNIIELRYCNRM